MLTNPHHGAMDNILTVQKAMIYLQEEYQKGWQNLLS